MCYKFIHCPKCENILKTTVTCIYPGGKREGKKCYRREEVSLEEFRKTVRGTNSQFRFTIACRHCRRFSVPVANHDRLDATLIKAVAMIDSPQCASAEPAPEPTLGLYCPPVWRTGYDSRFRPDKQSSSMDSKPSQGIWFAPNPTYSIPVPEKVEWSATVGPEAFVPKRTPRKSSNHQPNAYSCQPHAYDHQSSLPHVSILQPSPPSFVCREVRVASSPTPAQCPPTPARFSPYPIERRMPLSPTSQAIRDINEVMNYYPDGIPYSPRLDQ